MKLTAERCDECINVSHGRICWKSSSYATNDIKLTTPDEAELFAYRLLVAVKRARGE